MTRVELVIDELVLHGFEPCQRHAIADAMVAQLQTLSPAQLRVLIAAHRDSQSTPVLRAPDVTRRDVVPPPTLLGQRIAQSVVQSLSGGARSVPRG
jgi:hypothetical protein